MDKAKFEAILKQTVEKLSPYTEAVMKYLKKVLDFAKAHKILTAVVCVVLVVFISVFAIIYDTLSLINYDDGNIVDTTESTQSTINGLEYLSYTAKDGSLVFADGSYMTPTGTAVLCDGTTIYPTGIVAFTDGSYIVGSGIGISADGTATFSDAKQLHISQFYVQSDGKIIERVSDGSTVVVSAVSVGATYNSSSGSVILGQASSSSTSSSSSSLLPENLIQNSVDDAEAQEEQRFDEIMDNLEDSNISEDVRNELQQSDTDIDKNLDDNQIWYSDSVMNILLLGIDNNKNSDSMIVVSINKDTKKVKLVSFSRIAYAAIDGFGNSRLSHAHRFGGGGSAGVALVRSAIEKNYKIRIDNYISTSIKNFQTLIDCMGGVDIGLTKEELDTEVMQRSLSRQGYTNFSPNVYNLNGYSAMNYVRLRSIDSDWNRTQRQRNVLEAIAKKAKQMSILEIRSLIEEILPLVNTDLTKGEILSQMMNVYSYLSADIEQYVIPHKGYEVRRIEGSDVMLVKWDVEVPYVHGLFYAGLDVKYKTF